MVFFWSGVFNKETIAIKGKVNNKSREYLYKIYKKITGKYDK